MWKEVKAGPSRVKQSEKLYIMATPSQMNSIEDITTFLLKVNGFETSFLDEWRVSILQKADRQRILLDGRELETTIRRTDEMGREFIQVNFLGGAKILLTDDLIGFKPLPSPQYTQMNLSRLPKVVTTPDLISVIEAMDDAIAKSTSGFIEEEIKVLKCLYESIVAGAERVGFDLRFEKTWIAPFLGKQFTSKLPC